MQPNKRPQRATETTAKKLYTNNDPSSINEVHVPIFELKLDFDFNETNHWSTCRSPKMILCVKKKTSNAACLLDRICLIL